MQKKRGHLNSSRRHDVGAAEFDESTEPFAMASMRADEIAAVREGPSALRTTAVRLMSHARQDSVLIT